MSAIRWLQADASRVTLHASREIGTGALVCALLISGHAPLEVAVAKSNDQQLDMGGANQGGGTSTSNFRQQAAIGESMENFRLSSSRFRILPGLFGSGSDGAAPIVSELDLVVLYAKTDSLGADISQRTWQKDKDPIFIWQPPPTGPELAGYSYAFDGTPDDTVDTSATSLDVKTSALSAFTDGPHTFSVKAVNILGNAGKPISFELWVDTTPPQIVAYSPAPSALLNVHPTVTATLSDAHSGLNASSLQVLVNGAPVTVSFDESAKALSASGGTWKEGVNSLEIRAADVAGNTQSPLIWSVTVDTIPPSGTLTINAGALMTTSIFVTLGLSATDTLSGVSRILVSNQELADYVEEPYVALRSLWGLTPIRGKQSVYVKFVDQAGNVSAPVTDDIDLALLSPETVITSGPAGFTPDRTASFTFMCPEGECLFSYAFDNDEWSAWDSEPSASTTGLVFGNHYFRVKAAKDVNGVAEIQPDEEDPSPAERTWIVGVATPIFTAPKGPPIKLWRLE